MNKSEIFKIELIKASATDNYTSALEEFVLDRVDRESGKCICTHSIYNQCIMLNTTNSREVVVGNCCVRKFMTNEHKKQLKFLERKTYDCQNCDKSRIPKVTGALNDLCLLCSRNTRKCIDCGEYFLCQGDRRSYCIRCVKCYVKMKGNAPDVNVYRYRPRWSK